MRIRLFIGFLVFLLPSVAWCQKSFWASKIDSLKNVLPSLRDSAAVDALNDLSFRYRIADKKDSAELSATHAFGEATRLRYRRGMNEAALNKWATRNRYYHNWAATEVLAKRVLQLYEGIPNKIGMAFCAFELGFALFGQSKYEEAVLYLNKAFVYFKERNMTDEMLMVYSLTGQVYRESGNYKKAFAVFQQSLQLAQQVGNAERIIESHINIGDLYMAIEDYHHAIAYYRNNFTLQRPKEFGTDFLMGYAELLTRTAQYDSALYYFNLFDSAHAPVKDLRHYMVRKGEYYLARKAYTQAQEHLMIGFLYNHQLNAQNEMRRALLNLTKVYAALHQDQNVLTYGRQALDLALQTRSKLSVRDANQLLYTAYDHMGRTDSACYYFRQYAALKEEVASAQVKGRFAAYNYEQRIALLSKEKELQQAKLQQGVLQRNLLLAGIAVVLLLAFILVRNVMLKRRNEAHRRALAETELQIQKLEAGKLRSEMRQRTAELEMQALRAQMNPHFIFNCLNSINHFIVANDTEMASDYLTRFSRLIRMVLQSSSRKYICLGDELKTLELYIQLEQLRFEKHFRYSVYCDPELDAEMVMIPPMLLQPFVENAIWHGLMHLQQPGQLNIKITCKDGLLLCSIADNGIGRRRAAELKSKSASLHKSLGMQITANRLQMLIQESKDRMLINVIDRKDTDGQSQGTEVLVRIPVRTGQTISA